MPPSKNTASNPVKAGPKETGLVEPGETQDRGPALAISAPHPRRRAGISFGTVPVTIYEKDLDEKLLEELMADLVLVIRPKRETEE